MGQHSELPRVSAVTLPAEHPTPTPVLSSSSCWWKMEIEVELSKVGGEPQCVGAEEYHHGALLHGKERAEKEKGTGPSQSHAH